MDAKKRRPLTAAQELLKEAQHLEIARRSVANLCLTVLEDPQQNIDKLGELLRMFEMEEHMTIPDVRRILTLSTCELFSDILPSYRIRALTEKERNQQAKKETKRLQKFEERLMTSYKKFTIVLAKFIRCQVLTLKSKRQLLPGEVDHRTAVKCAAALLRSHPNFNLAEDLMKMLIPVVNQNPEAIKSKIRSSAFTAASDAFEALLHEDRVGEPSLLLARGIVQFAQARAYRIAPALVSVLLWVNVREVAKEGQKARASYKERQQWSRKERKQEKHNSKFERQMEESRASQSRETRLQLNTKIISQVFLLYFKVLKLEKVDPQLLSAALTGLSKHAQLLSVEYFDDLFSTIARILENERLSPADGLSCVHTAMVVLTGDGAALQVDSRRFYRHLYGQLLPALGRVRGPPPQQLLDCLELMIVQRRKEVSSQRALAFAKRMASCALLAAPPSLSVALLELLHRLLRLDSRLAPVLLDADCDKGQGSFDPDAEEAEFANAASTALWELPALTRHVCPAVRRRADLILSGATAPAGQQQQLSGAAACAREADLALQSGPGPKTERQGRRKGRKRSGAPMPEWLQQKMRRHRLALPADDVISTPIG